MGRNGDWIDAQLDDALASRTVVDTTVVSAPTGITLASIPDDALSYMLSFLFAGGPDKDWDAVALALNIVFRLNKAWTRRLTA